MRLIYLLLSLIFVSCVGPSKEDKKAHMLYELCVNVGVWYHKDHGHYPSLPNGDFVEFVVSKECKKNIHAYGDVKLKPDIEASL